MTNDTTVLFADPSFADALSDLVRAGEQRIIQQTVQAELNTFLRSHPNQDGQGRRLVTLPKTRDRAGLGRRFSSALLPPYLKKTRRLESVLQWLYIKGVSTNDFDEALKALFSESVKGLSASTISRLKVGWETEHETFRERDWRGHEMVYLWADGIYINVRAAERRCVLVVIGCDRHGRKHFLTIEEGFRESTESWKALLMSLRDRGLTVAPKLAVGDGAMGFWSALAEIYPKTAVQRCWVHKTANVLDTLPKRIQPQAKGHLHEIWQADTGQHAEQAFDRFLATYDDKYPKATGRLAKDRAELLAFYEFPVAHWQHLRNSNPIESTFATIRLRTAAKRNCVGAKNGLALVQQLAMSAQKRWRRLRGFKQLADVICGVQFIYGIDERELSRKAA